MRCSTTNRFVEARWRSRKLSPPANGTSARYSPSGSKSTDNGLANFRLNGQSVRMESASSYMIMFEDCHLNGSDEKRPERPSADIVQPAAD